MAKLTMHERVPFDEATAQAMVSTGELPGLDQVRDAAVEAYERYRPVTDGEVADYIPALAARLPRPVRHQPGRRARPDLRRRRHRHGVLDPERLQAVRVRAGVREHRLRGGAAAARGQRHRVPVRLGDGRRAERRAHDEPDGQRRGHRDHEPDPRRHRGGEVGAGARRAVAVRGPGAVARRRRLRVRGGVQPAQPRHRPPAGELRPGLVRPRRGHRRLHPAVLAGRHRPRPRGDGGDPRRRRREPGDRGAGDRPRGVPAGARGDGDRRALRALRRLALRDRAARQERGQRRHRDRGTGQGRPRDVLATAGRGRQQRARPAGHEVPVRAPRPEPVRLGGALDEPH